MSTQFQGALKDAGATILHSESEYHYGKTGAGGTLAILARNDKVAELSPSIGDLHPFSAEFEVIDVRVVGQSTGKSKITAYYDLVGGDTNENPSLPGTNSLDVPPDEYWIDGGEAIFRTTNPDGDVVLDQGRCTFEP